MKNKKEPKIKPLSPKIDPYLEGIVTKLIDRLVALEKKMDTIIAQTAKPSSGGWEPSKPAAPQPLPPRREKTLYEAVCAQCSKVCEVPFKPVEGRPVYCKTCWADRKNGSLGKSGNGMPVLTPVALPAKPFPRPLSAAPAPAATAKASPKKAKKGPVKKKKK